MAYPIQNPAVLEIGKINFVGDIIPHEWYQHIKYENGKACHHAIAILANIVYWYRPTTIKDEATGGLIAHQQKFKAESLQRSYQSFADQFGLTRRQAQAACDLLESLGLIKRYTKAMSSGQGTIQKALYIDLCVERVKEITFSSYDSTYVEPSSYVFDVHSNVRSTTLERTYTETTHSSLTESLSTGSRLEGATRSINLKTENSSVENLIADLSDLFVPDKSMRIYLREIDPAILRLAINQLKQKLGKGAVKNPGGYLRNVIKGLLKESTPTESDRGTSAQEEEIAARATSSATANDRQRPIKLSLYEMTPNPYRPGEYEYSDRIKVEDIPVADRTELNHQQIMAIRQARAEAIKLSANPPKWVEFEEDLFGIERLDLKGINHWRWKGFDLPAIDQTVYNSEIGKFSCYGVFIFNPTGKNPTFYLQHKDGSFYRAVDCVWHDKSKDEAVPTSVSV